METAARLRLAGLVGGIALGASVSLGSWSVFGPPIFAGALFLGVLAAEVALPRPERSRVASATLRERRVRDYLPQPAARGVVALAAIMVGVIGLGILGRITAAGFTFTGIDLTNALRYLINGDWAYGMQGVVGSAVLTVLGSLALGLILLRLVVRSPRTGSDAEQRRRDEAWRRRTARVIVAALGAFLSGLVAGVGFGVASSLAEAEIVPFLSLLGSLVGAAALVAFGGYVAMLLRTDDAPASPAAEPATITAPVPSPSPSPSPLAGETANAAEAGEALTLART
jgi:hypothetical protein